MSQTLRDRIAAVFQEHSYAVIAGRYGKPGDWADRVIDICKYFPDQTDDDANFTVSRSERRLTLRDMAQDGQRTGPHDK